MKGIPSYCKICGVSGYTYGCPSWSDVCVDKDTCRKRAIENERRETTKLRTRIKELEEQLIKERSDE
jgi:hypothetical protein